MLVFVAARGLPPAAVSGELRFLVVPDLTVSASLVADHRLWVPGLQQLPLAGSVVVAPGLSCSGTWDPPSQRWNPRALC